LLKEAEEHLSKGVEFCERINFHLWNAGRTISPWGVLLRNRRFPEIQRILSKESWVLEHNQLFPSWALLGKVGSARSKVMNKEKDVNLESLYAYSRNNKIKAAEGWIQRYIGEILLNIDDQHISEAEHWIQKAIEADQRNRMMFHLGKDYALYAELLKRKGDRFKSQENLGKAIEILKECGADGWVEKYEKELTTFS